MWWRVLGLNGGRHQSGHLERGSNALLREDLLRILGVLWPAAMFWLEVATGTKGEGTPKQSRASDRVMATSSLLFVSVSPLCCHRFCSLMGFWAPLAPGSGTSENRAK